MIVKQKLCALLLAMDLLGRGKVAANKTLEHLHEMRASTLPIEASAFSKRHGRVLSVDAACLRLWSLRRELMSLPRPPRSPPVVQLLSLEALGGFIVVLGGGSDGHSVDASAEAAGWGASSCKVLNPILGVRAAWPALVTAGESCTAATIHGAAAALICGGTNGEICLWSLRPEKSPVERSTYTANGGSDSKKDNASSSDDDSSDLAVVCGPVLRVSDESSVSILCVDESSGLLFAATANGTIWAWRLHSDTANQSKGSGSPGTSVAMRGSTVDGANSASLAEASSGGMGFNGGGGGSGGTGSARALWKQEPTLVARFLATSVGSSTVVTALVSLQPNGVGATTSDGALQVRMSTTYETVVYAGTFR